MKVSFWHTGGGGGVVYGPKAMIVQVNAVYV